MDQILRKNILTWTEKLTNTLRVILHLLQREIISDQEHKSLNSEPAGDKQNSSLLMILRKKDEGQLGSILQILEETGNGPLCNLIKDTAKQQGLQKLISAEVSSQIGRQFEPTKDEPTKPTVMPSFGKVSVTRGGVGVQNNYNFPSDKITKKSTLSSKLPINKCWPEVKVQTRSFYERKIDGELIVERLHRMLQENENNTTVITQDKVVVSGLGGIGKTTIAKSFALHYEKEYEHIIWIDCGEGSFVASINSLAMDLKIEPRNEPQVQELARKSFEALQQFKCLIIFDNAECYVGKEGIRDILPKHKNLHSIITSRNQEWGTSTGYGKVSIFLLNTITQDESLHFMKKNLNVEIEDWELKRLGNLLGHLPLALQIAVATLNNQLITISEYIQLIENNEKILGETFDDYEKTINKIIKISLDQIKGNSNKRIATIATSILTVFGYIQADEVEFEFLQIIENITPTEMADAIALLKKYSLIVHEKNKNSNNVSIHRLLQQVIRHNSTAEKETLRKILGCKNFIKYKCIPFTKYADQGLQEEFPNVKAELLDQEELNKLLREERFGECVELAKFIKKELKTNSATFNYSICLDKNGQYDEAVAELEKLDKGNLKERIDYKDVDIKMGILGLETEVSKELIAGHLLYICWKKNKSDQLHKTRKRFACIHSLESQEAFLQIVSSNSKTTKYCIRWGRIIRLQTDVMENKVEISNPISALDCTEILKNWEIDYLALMGENVSTSFATIIKSKSVFLKGIRLYCETQTEDTVQNARIKNLKMDGVRIYNGERKEITIEAFFIKHVNLHLS